MADVHLSTTELTRWRDHGDGDRDRIVAHLAVCPVCRHIAAELERERPLETVSSQFDPREFVAQGYRAGNRPAVASVTPRLVYVAAAAVLVLAAVFVPSWWRSRSDSTLRGGGIPVTLIRPVDTTTSAADLAFEWTAQPGVDRLRLHLVSIDEPEKPLIDREVSGTRYEPTADERARLQPGRELHWFIEYREAGATTGTSPAASFRLP